VSPDVAATVFAHSLMSMPGLQMRIPGGVSGRGRDTTATEEGCELEDGFTLERAFEEMERRAEAAGRAARKLASALTKAHRAGKNGDLHALRRALH
jgi:hypothetical protein